MRLNSRLLKIGNRNASSDAAAGLIMAKAAADSALLNVRINLKYMNNNSYSEEQLLKIKLFSEDCETILRDSLSLFNRLMDPEGEA
jgi:formiminotetrahydrofolate cyclodeaminase